MLRADAKASWATFADKNASVLNQRFVDFLYLVDEPYWNGVSTADLAKAVEIVEATHPTLPKAIVEAFWVLDALVVPEQIDIVGFDRYAIPDPETDLRYLADFAKLKAARSRPDQKILLVADSQWLPLYGSAGFPQEAMAAVGRSSLNLAVSDPDVVGIIGYTWPGGLGDPQQRGLRNLPDSVQNVYKEFGRAVVAATRSNP